MLKSVPIPAYLQLVVPTRLLRQKINQSYCHTIYKISESAFLSSSSCEWILRVEFGRRRTTAMLVLRLLTEDKKQGKEHLFHFMP